MVYTQSHCAYSKSWYILKDIIVVKLFVYPETSGSPETSHRVLKDVVHLYLFDIEVKWVD